MDVAGQVQRNLQRLGVLVHLVVPYGGELGDLPVHCPHVRHGLDDVPGAGLPLGADHGRPLADAPEGLSQIPRPADEGHLEPGLVDVVDVVGGGEDLALVDVVDVDGLEDLGLHEMADPALRHHRYGDGLLDPLYHLGVRHPGHAARGTDVRRDPLQRHDGACAASSAILACSGVVTSMMTPPFSICASSLLSPYLSLNPSDM